MKLFEIMQQNQIIIQFDGEQYKVMSPDGREEAAAYTDDKEDAIGTARANYGNDINIKFKRVKNTEAYLYK